MTLYIARAGEIGSDLWGFSVASTTDFLDEGFSQEQIKLLKNGIRNPNPEEALEYFIVKKDDRFVLMENPNFYEFEGNRREWGRVLGVADSAGDADRRLHDICRYRGVEEMGIDALEGIIDLSGYGSLATNRRTIEKEYNSRRRLDLSSRVIASAGPTDEGI